MPPELDIYALTCHRDRATIERFLDEYVDRAANEERGDEELMLESLAFFAESSTVQPQRVIPDTAYEWEPAHTLTHIINRGLDKPRRAFTVYLTAKIPESDRIILAFTRDDQLGLGLSLEDGGAARGNEVAARSHLAHLMATSQCYAGIVVVEQHPPMDEREFRARAREAFTVFSTILGEQTP